MQHENQSEKLFFMTKNKKYYCCFTLTYNITQKLHNNIKFKAWVSWYSHPGDISASGIRGSFSSTKEAKDSFYKSINFFNEDDNDGNYWIEIKNNKNLIKYLNEEYNYSEK